jgi:phosphoglycerate dehydrogenase-like enzyme
MRIATVPDAEWIERVGPVEGVEVRSWDMSTPLPDPEIGYAVHPYLTSPARVANVGSVPGHRVVQLMTAGYDAHLAHLHADVSLCNAAGVHDAATAEQAVTLMLAALRGIPEFVQAQARATWLPIRMWSGLADKRVLIVGYGRIGRAIAARLAPFEVSLTAVASRPRAGDDLVPVVHGMDELPTLLPHADVVVLVVPLLPATTGLVDADFLAAMPAGSLLVNIARGPVVDTDALLAALHSGRIRAALDVTDPEPLPDGHPLWTAPDVLISPHVGGASNAFYPRAAALIRTQLQRYAVGQPPLHIVAGPSADRSTGR